MTAVTGATADTRAVSTIVRPRLASHPMLALVAFGGAAALVAWLRLPAVTRDTLWAEDGRNFLQGAIDSGPVNSLLIPYAGYLHTIPRLIAVAVEAVPVSGWAIGMTAGACLVAGIVTVTVFVATRGIIDWMPARIAIASLTVLAPLAPREVLGNAANVHSLLMWALFWIVLSRPTTRASTIGLSAVALLGSLTEVQSLFLLPLLLVHPTDRRRWPARAMLLIGVVAQVVVTVVFPRATSGHSPDSPLSIGYGYLINAVMPLGVPQASIGPALDAVGPVAGILMLIPLVLAAVTVMRRGSSTERVVVVALAAGSVVVFCASVVANPRSFYQYADLTSQQLAHPWLIRYGVVPSMMLAAILLIGLGVAVRNGRFTVLGGVSALLLVSLIVQFVPFDTRRSSGPEWQPQLAAAAERCESLPPTTRVPLRETLGWHVDVPCSRLREPRPDPLR